MFPYYPLVEGAIVAELCNLAQARLGNARSLFPEVAYSKITGGGRHARRDTPEGSR